MATWRLKGCPRCGGDVIVDRDESQCLQCGFGGVEPSEFALAVQARVREEPMTNTDGRGKWDRGGSGRNRKIRELREEGVPLKDIGRKYHLTTGMVSLIARGLR